MAGEEEIVSRDQYQARVKQEHKKLLIQTALMLLISLGISLFFFIQVSPKSTPAAE